MPSNGTPKLGWNPSTSLVLRIIRRLILAVSVCAEDRLLGGWIRTASSLDFGMLMKSTIEASLE